jgi:AcrR family transcriptional regulator
MSNLSVELPQVPVAPRTQLQRRREAESKLLVTAREIVSRKGWAGTTLTEVGEAAGYSRGLAGHYFGSKAGLLRALTQQINGNMEEELSRAEQPKPGLDAITSFVAVYLGRKDPRWTNTRVVLLLMTEALLDDSENAEQMTRFNAAMFTHLERNIQTGIAKGEIRADVLPSIGAELIVGMLRGFMLQRLVKRSEVCNSALRKQIIDLIRHALASAASDKLVRTKR